MQLQFVWLQLGTLLGIRAGRRVGPGQQVPRNVLDGWGECRAQLEQCPQSRQQLHMVGRSSWHQGTVNRTLVRTGT